MNPLISMAIRNVGRNKRRTLITIITVVLGTVVVIQVRGLISGLQAEMIRNLTRKVNGDLQIHRTGYQDNLDSNPFDYLLPLESAKRADFQGRPGIAAATGRLRVFGMLNNQRTQKTTPVFITGIDPVQERDVCPRVTLGVGEGEFLKAASQMRAAVSGAGASMTGSLDDAPELELGRPVSNLPAKKSSAPLVRHDILLTPALTRGLGAKIGDELVILLKDSNNMEQAIIGRLAGTLDMNLPMAAAKMAWIDLGILQQTLHVGERVSEIVLRSQDGADLHRLQKQLQSSEGDSVIVERWDEVAGFFSEVMGLQNAVFKIVLAIMFVIVSSAIINTSMMTVSERVREIGTLMAIGYKRKHIMLIFLVESTTIGLLGGLSGVVIGVSTVTLLGHLGLEFNFPGTRTPITIEPFVTPEFILFVLLLACMSALLAALYPSYRASRLSPVKALSSN